MNSIETDALNLYQKNLDFFEKKEPELFKKIKLLETSFNLGYKETDYELDYRDDYFEIFDKRNNKYYYGENSLEYSKKATSTINGKVDNCSFKAFYEERFTDDIFKISEESDIFSDTRITNGLICHYVTKQIPPQEELKDIRKFIILGVGLGLHIPLVLKKIKPEVLMICEQNLEIFRLSLFVTDYKEISKSAILYFSISELESDFLNSFNRFYNRAFLFNHYFKFLLLNNDNYIYTKFIQRYLVQLPHVMFAYDRKLKSLYRTIHYINEEIPIINLAYTNSFKDFDKPILLLGAGPSLQYNIDFVKENQNKYCIVALLVTMPLLEKYNIKPDMVFQYDEGDDIVMRNILCLKDLNFFKDTIFIFSSHVTKSLVDSFSKEQIFMFQAMYLPKPEFGLMTAPSIGEITYAILLKFGMKNISMLGIDMAIDEKTNKSHIDGHIANEKLNIKEQTGNTLDLKQTKIFIKGNFQNQVPSLTNYQVSIDAFNEISGIFIKDNNDVNVYNLSNGAFLDYTIPKYISDINLDDVEEFNKKELKSIILNNLNNISEKSFTQDEREEINKKLIDARILKNLTKDFFSVKKSIHTYEIELAKFVEDIYIKKRTCLDLQEILKNYILNIFHYSFYLMTLRDVKNLKKHMKVINKYLELQIKKIIDKYIEVYERSNQ